MVFWKQNKSNLLYSNSTSFHSCSDRYNQSVSSKSQFALQFTDADVHFIIRKSDDDNWSVSHSIPLDDPAFEAELLRFSHQVSNDCSIDSSVVVFLDDADIQCGSVSVIGRNAAMRDKHVRRTLARRHSDQAENIVAHYGAPQANKIAPVCFALRTTLEAAEQFVQGFGFKVSYFSKFSNHGLDMSPCLQLAHQHDNDNYHVSTVAPVVKFAFRGAVAAMALGGTFIATSLPQPDTELMAGLRDNGNVSQLPVKPLILTAGYQVPKLHASLPKREAVAMVNQTWNTSYSLDVAFGSVQPISLKLNQHDGLLKMAAVRETPNFAASQKMDFAASLFGAYEMPDTPNTFPTHKVTTFTVSTSHARQHVTVAFELRKDLEMGPYAPVLLHKLAALRATPNQTDAEKMDKIASLKGGFYVYLGQQSNLTQGFTDAYPSASSDQVVFVDAMDQPTFQVARLIDPIMVKNSRFLLTELELASFSRP